MDKEKMDPDAFYIEDGNITIKTYLHDLILENKLFVSGHFGLNKTKSARDWINLERLFALEQEKFIDPITRAIYRYILKEMEANLTLIGFDYYGAILASVIGFNNNIPFTYCFRDQSIVDEIEKEIQDINSKHLVIITDVIVFGSTLCKFIKHLSREKLMNHSTIDVVALFERKIADDYFPMIYFQQDIRNIYILNNDFDIEICKKNKEKCLFTEDMETCKFRYCQI